MEDEIFEIGDKSYQKISQVVEKVNLTQFQNFASLFQFIVLILIGWIS